MKKLLSLTIVLALAVCSLASCGGDSKDTTADTKADTTVADTKADMTDTETKGDTTTAGGETTTDDKTEQTDAQTSDAPANTKALLTIDFTDEDACDLWELGATGTADDAYYDDKEKCFVVDIVQDDAQIQCNSFEDGEEIDVEDIKSITIVAKNATNDTKGQIFFFLDNTTAPSEACSVFYDYQYSGENAEWETVTITFDEDSLPGNWEGYLTGFRFDISDHGTEGHVYLKSLIVNG